MAGRAVRVHQSDFAGCASGTLVGSLVLALLVVGLMAPRTFAFTLPLVPIAFALTRLWRRRAGRPAASTDVAMTSAQRALIVAASAFIAWSAVSALWSVAPLMSLAKALVAGAIIASVVFCINEAYRLSDADAARLGEGVWIGVMLGAALLLIEVYTDGILLRLVVNALHISPQALKPQMYYIWQGSRLVQVAVDDLNRQVVSLVLLAGSGMLAARATMLSPWARGLWAVVAAATVIVVAGSATETAKLALLVSVLIGGLALLSRKAAFSLLVVGWLSATMLIVPVLQITHAAGIDRSPAVVKALARGSASERFKILNAFVARIGEAPLLGHGANAAYVIGPQEIDELDNNRAGDGGPVKAPLAQHPHNAYLQIWFDLGIVGAALFAAFGLAVLGVLRRLDAGEQPAAFATFAAAAAIMAPSYGLWQFWYMAMFGVGAIALGLAVRANRAGPGGAPTR